MATLLELTQQVDPGTVPPTRKARTRHQLMEPQQLYELWERQHWASQEIDLTSSERLGTNLDEADREECLWGLSSFFVGEARVATEFSGSSAGLRGRAGGGVPRRSRSTRRAHAVLRPLVPRGAGLRRRPSRPARDGARHDVSDAFIELFDGVLVDAGKRLIDDPQNIEAKVDYIVTYHLLIEGVLALTGQHFMTKFFETRGILPGFVEGFTNISRDEHRHVAYGTRGSSSRRRARSGTRSGSRTDRRVAARDRGRARAEGQVARRRVHVHGLLEPGAGRVVVRRAHAALEVIGVGLPYPPEPNRLKHAHAGRAKGTRNFHTEESPLARELNARES